MVLGVVIASYPLGTIRIADDLSVTVLQSRRGATVTCNKTDCDGTAEWKGDHSHLQQNGLLWYCRVGGGPQSPAAKRTVTVLQSGGGTTVTCSKTNKAVDLYSAFFCSVILKRMSSTMVSHLPGELFPQMKKIIKAGFYKNTILFFSMAKYRCFLPSSLIKTYFLLSSAITKGSYPTRGQQKCTVSCTDLALV